MNANEKLKIGISFLFPFLLCFSSYAQQEKVTFQFWPKNTLLRIDGDTTVYDFSKSEQALQVELPRGKHLIELWAPGYVLLRDTVEVKKRSKYHANVYRKKLEERTPEYVAHAKLLKSYKEKKFLRNGTKIALLTADVVLPIYSIFVGRKDLKQRKEELEGIPERYALAVNSAELEEMRTKYERLQPDYAKKRKAYNQKLIIGSSLSALSIGVTILHFKSMKKKEIGKRPEFTPVNPFVSSFQFNENEFGGKEFGLTITF